MKPYPEGTKVFYWSDDNILRQGIVIGIFGGFSDCSHYYVIQISSKNNIIREDEAVHIDKKKLLLKLLLISQQEASQAKKRMAYFNERSDKLCSYLQKMDKNMDIIKELENYKEETKNNKKFST